MARTKVNEEEKEGAVGAKRVRKMELVATVPKAKGTKARKTDTKRVEVEETKEEEDKPVDVVEEEPAAEAAAEAEAAEEKAEEPAAAEEEGEEKEKVKRRHRPGQAAKVRVRRARKNVLPRFALAAWARAVRSVAHTISPQVMFQASALTHLRAVTEGVALRVFQEAGILMRANDKKRLSDTHVAVAAALRFQQAPGHTNAAYAQLRREGYEHFELGRSMNFDYYETKQTRVKKAPKPKAEGAAAAADA